MKIASRVSRGWTVLGAACMVAPAAGQVLERSNPRDWTLGITVNVRAVTIIDPETRLPRTEKWDVQTAAVVFPVLESSASHQPRESRIESKLTANDRTVDTEPEMLKGYASGVRLGKWALTNWSGQEVELQLTIPMTTWETRLDEEAAKRLAWPAKWPAEAESAFLPQMYVDVAPGDEPYDMEPVRELVRKWTKGQDPKSQPQVVTAKWLAGQVMQHVQLSGDGLSFNRVGQLEGIDLQGAPETARRGRGSDFDAVTLLAAVYREAGIPARTVIGVDAGEDKDGRFLAKRGGRSSLRAWVEFAMYDGSRNALTWVPVDIVRMRRASNRPPPLEREWKFFGTHDELNRIAPFAFQFFPPTTVRSYGSPGFWGWLVTPEAPYRAVQGLRFSVMRTPRTAEDARERER